MNSVLKEDLELHKVWDKGCLGRHRREGVWPIQRTAVCSGCLAQDVMAGYEERWAGGQNSPS